MSRALAKAADGSWAGCLGLLMRRRSLSEGSTSSSFATRLLGRLLLENHMIGFGILLDSQLGSQRRGTSSGGGEGIWLTL